MSKALIIIDIQYDYFENGKSELVGAKEAAEKARLLLDKFRKDRLPVIHIQHIANRAGATFFIPGTKGSEIHEIVKPTQEEKLIIKHFPNSFRETGLLGHLQSNNITELIIAGMITHMCVDSTTRAAKDLGFNCTVISDACATKDLEINKEKVKAAEVQKAFLSALSHYYSTVKTTDEYLNNTN